MNDFGSKIYAAAQKAVKEVYDLEPAEGQLIIETPQDTKLGDYSTSIAMKLYDCPTAPNVARVCACVLCL